MGNSTLISGAHTTLRLSGFPTLICVPLSLTVYSGWTVSTSKRALEDKLRSLVVPTADVAVQAGRLLEDLPRLWKKADLGERRRILVTMPDAVYVDTVEEKHIVAVRPRPAFRPLLEIAATREGSGVVLVNEKNPENTSQPPPDGQGADGGPCLWWRRVVGAERYLKHELPVLLTAA